MSGEESEAGSKGTIPESDAESVLDVIGQMQETGTFDSSRLPKDPVIRQRLDEIVVTIGKVQNFALCISKGDLDSRLDAKGISAGSLKFLQSNLRHLTWQAQQIAAGDFSQRVDFMGEFSEAFNHMVMALDAARAEMRQRELELSSLNARLSTEVTVRRQAEETLRLQNRIFETIAEGVYLIRARDGVIVYTNSKFEKMFGYEKGELISKHVSVVNAPEEKMSPRDTAEEIMKTLNEKGEWRGEVRNIRKDGTTFWCLAVVSTFEHPEFGSVWISAHTDITARKRAEQQIAESSRFLATLIDTLPVPVFFKDVSGKYLGCNPPFEEYIGISRNNLIGKTAYDISPTDLADRYTAADREVFDKPLPQRYETQVRFANGSRHDVIFYKARFLNADGSVAGLIGTFLDITERKKAEEAILQSEQKFRDIFNNTTDAIHIHGINDDGTPGRFTDVNDVACRMLGYIKEEMLTKTPLDISTGYHNPSLERVFEEQRTTGIARFETEHRAKDGTIIPVEVNTHVVTILGKKVMLGVVRDITERKKAEALLKRFNEELEQKVKIRTEELNASLDEKVVLLREVHHRVKNNLQILISLLNLQSRTISDPKVIAALKESTQRIRAMSMVHEKLYTGMDLAHIEFINYLSSLANSQVAFYGLSPGRIKLEIRGGNIMLDINTAIPLGLVMNELVSNALKHAFPGDRKGTIRIDARETEGRLEITLADDGIGVPGGFDAKTSPTLGLRLVDILIEQLSGTITLDLTKTGTVYHISIPMKER